MERKYINILSKIGETKILDKKSIQILTNIDDGYYLNYSENWKEFEIKSLSNIELINVFQGLIVAEKCYSQLCGSATIGIILYKEIEARNIDQEKKIANWVYINTKNGYNPFGTNGNIRAKSKDVYDFVQNKKDYSKQVEVELEHKEKRLLIKKNKGLEKLLLQKENEVKTLKIRLELSKLSRIEMANEIINDSSKPVYYYSIEIDILIKDKSVDKKLLKTILNKFKEREKKSTNKLKNRLIEEIKNR